jgi:hypothetical protein
MCNFFGADAGANMGKKRRAAQDGFARKKLRSFPDNFLKSLHVRKGARSICAKTSSTLKLDGFCRGGKSLNDSTNCATNGS